MEEAKSVLVTLFRNPFISSVGFCQRYNLCGQHNISRILSVHNVFALFIFSFPLRVIVIAAGHKVYFKLPFAFKQDRETYENNVPISPRNRATSNGVVKQVGNKNNLTG